MKKKNIFFDSIEYLKESKNYLIFALIVFLFGVLIALISPDNFNFFDEILKKILSRIEGLGPFEIIIFILQNNLISAFLALFLGIFLGIMPFFNALVNGALLGYVISRVIEIEGLSVLWRLVPHGIFELPAIFIAIGLGIKLGMFIFSRPIKKSLMHRFIASVKVFFSIILPLLVIAAIIEGLLITFL